MESAGFGGIKDKQYCIGQVLKGNYRIHLDIIHLKNRPVQKPWSVDDLNMLPMAFGMSDLNTFGGERVICNLRFGFCDLPKQG